MPAMAKHSVFSSDARCVWRKTLQQRLHSMIAPAPAGGMRLISPQSEQARSDFEIAPNETFASCMP